MIAKLACLLIACASAAPIPQAAWQYQKPILRANWTYHGTDQYVAATAAQIHQESLWRARAQSPVGAEGLTQFMPATARGESRRCGLGLPAPFDPDWAIQAQSCYMAYLVRRNPEFRPGCQRYAAALSGYNGGQGNVNRQRRKWAAYTHHDARHGASWFNGVENYRVRSKAAHRENRGYPRRILLELTPRYVGAAYGGADLCH